MKKYTLEQILNAWFSAYGEDMNEEYAGFIQRLSEEVRFEDDGNIKKQQEENLCK
tara:strand:- start:124 stop:288 length:165 start_codon:yes stop_codon:yes gene_type:complete